MSEKFVSALAGVPSSITADGGLVSALAGTYPALHRIDTGRMSPDETSADIGGISLDIPHNRRL